jgi:hypothetical protein
MVAVERLATCMAQIDAAMESLKEKRIAAKEQQKRRTNETASENRVEEREREDTERTNRDELAITKDEIEMLRSIASVEDILELREVREVLDSRGPLGRSLTRIKIDPTDEVLTKRLSIDAIDKVDLCQVPSMVEFPTNFEHDESAMGGGVDSVAQRLQLFCSDIYWGQTFSVLGHIRSRRLERSLDLD